MIFVYPILFSGCLNYLYMVLLLFHLGMCGHPYHLKMKLNYHRWFMLFLLQHAMCIAWFICIGSYVVDLWSRPYRYSIMGCSSTPCWVCRLESFSHYIHMHSQCVWKCMSILLWSSIIWLCSKLEGTFYILILYHVYSISGIPH